MTAALTPRKKPTTMLKKGTLHNRREVLKKIRDKDVVHSLFAEIVWSFARPQRRLPLHHPG